MIVDISTGEYLDEHEAERDAFTYAGDTAAKFWAGALSTTEAAKDACRAERQVHFLNIWELPAVCGS
ncbi:hypothetical protein [Gulosibacter faecalis]|uniref:Uncharacterized protein n=1 Tax=Gulosibacter faecalis TaxID=272240 RepID=A0ABW5UV11_9MICO|nr:hypothetical protein [Gulosibacter faecalis]